MEKEKKKENKKKGVIAAIVGVVVIVVAIIVAIVVAANVNKNEMAPIEDGYFVSDDSKLVLNMDGDNVEMLENSQRPIASHTVYYYSGDKIDSMKIFFEYANDERANEISELMGDSYKEWANDKKVNGKYIVFLMDRSRYEGLTVDAVRKVIEDVKTITGENIDEDGDADEDENIDEDEDAM